MTDIGAEKSDKNNRLSATAILKLTEEMQVRLFHTPARDPFARFPVKNHWENWPVKSSTFEDWLSALCYHKVGLAPNRNAVVEARNVLAGHALYGNPELPVYVRIADRAGTIYLDLGNDSWEAVAITSDGWQVVDHVPVKFLRPPGMLPLPRPIAVGGTIDDLRPFLNVCDEEQWVLAVSWLIGALRRTGPFPILIVEGTHGSAKSTFSRVLLSLVDPNAAPLRAAPGNPRDLAISARNSWCLGFDNLSSVRPWLSDALCRLSTGGGFSTRTLYTDDSERIFEGMRPVLLNGIDIGLERPTSWIGA